MITPSEIAKLLEVTYELTTDEIVSYFESRGCKAADVIDALDEGERVGELRRFGGKSGHSASYRNATKESREKAAKKRQHGFMQPTIANLYLIRTTAKIDHHDWIEMRDLKAGDSYDSAARMPYDVAVKLCDRLNEAANGKRFSEPVVTAMGDRTSTEAE
jgi:hypothetical protein